MKWTRIIAFMLVLMLSWSAAAWAQGQTTGAKKRKPAARSKQPPVDARAEAAKVAGQLKFLIRFLYLYGKISAGLETADEQAKRGELSPELQAQIARNKASIVENIKNLRVGLEQLEQSLQSGSRQQPLPIQLVGASDRAGRAEQLAAAGRFEEAGRTLLGVAERLLDLLAESRE